MPWTRRAEPMPSDAPVERITLLCADERLAFPRQHSGDTPQIEYVRADLLNADDARRATERDAS